ncbi:MAG TPA: zinc-binding dehydrogenase [Clostridia bacterium]|jgi:threonine dehydrogenase-like Zn-dependent dehydrogenase|nr:zinc-binding dehydrogenase [Clostridia bacterium]HOL60480.1 zinc-binding dehydrogenase [Clostridia bacterium]HPO52887.1 zinc-binding dehydrogenase [Clostridia bacterium]
MKLYRTNGNNEFEITESDASWEPGLVKLKISTILPTMTDIFVYQGKMNINYPVVPCRAATAIVSEDRPEYGLKRGAKVIINPYILSSADEEGYARIATYGIEADGFLRDFVALPPENLIPFPEEVKEEEGVFTDIVALALAAINSFNLEKGDYIAVIGDSILSNLICQLALYYQAIPIYVFSDERHLSIAEKCGIFYTVNETKEDTYQRVLNITGGRLADHTILHAKSGVSPNFLYTLCARGGDCTIVSFSPILPRLETDIGIISQKQLTVRGVSCGLDEINSAVNMIAQKYLKFAQFIDKRATLEEAPEVFAEMSDDPLIYVCPIIKVL